MVQEFNDCDSRFFSNHVHIVYTRFSESIFPSILKEHIKDRYVLGGNFENPDTRDQRGLFLSIRNRAAEKIRFKRHRRSPG